MDDYYFPIIGAVVLVKVLIWVCVCALRSRGAFGQRRRITIITANPATRQTAYPQAPYTMTSPVLNHEVPPDQSCPPGAYVGQTSVPVQPPSYDEAIHAPKPDNQPVKPPEYNQIANSANIPAGGTASLATAPVSPAFTEPAQPPSSDVSGSTSGPSAPAAPAGL